MKKCTKCQETKELTEFYKDKISKDGLQYYCKICDRANTRDWINDNPKRVKESRAKWYRNNPELAKENVAKWIKDNPKRVKEARAKWAKTEKGKIDTSRHRATRKDRIKKATPPWITKTQKAEIQYLKNLCKEENKKIKDPKNKWTLNHLIPIRMTDTGTTRGVHIASGLHVPWNLKLVSKSENSKIACRMSSFKSSPKA